MNAGIAYRLATAATASDRAGRGRVLSLTSGQQSIIDSIRSSWIIGSSERARDEIERLATRFGVDEVMVNPLAGTYSGTDAPSAPSRKDTLRLLANNITRAQRRAS